MTVPDFIKIGDFISQGSPETEPVDSVCTWEAFLGTDSRDGQGAETSGSLLSPGSRQAPGVVWCGLRVREQGRRMAETPVQKPEKVRDSSLQQGGRQQKRANSFFFPP